jgi:hypothetical protein
MGGREALSFEIDPGTVFRSESHKENVHEYVL